MSGRSLCREFSDEGISEMDVQRRQYKCKRLSSNSAASEGYVTSTDSESLSSDDSDRRECSEAQIKMDSLTRALQELSIADSAATNFFEAHMRMRDSADDLLEVRSAAYQRSSSMKTKKTPPGTPNQMKKAVRFADAFGLDLTYVRHVFDSESPPVIPPQATRHLHLDDSTECNSDCSDDCQAVTDRLDFSATVKLVVSPRFPQPGASANFLLRVATQKVVLESAHVVSDAAIGGVIRVANVSFEKSVSVRATLSNWNTWWQVNAFHIPGSSDSLTDKFSFEVSADLGVGDKLVFCIRYSVNGEVYWDNNFGENYAFDCYTVN